MQNLGWEGIVGTTRRHLFPPVLPYTVMNNWFGGQKAAEELGFWKRRRGDGEPSPEQGQGPGAGKGRAGAGRAELERAGRAVAHAAPHIPW